MKVTTRTVWRFFLKELKGKVDFCSVRNYLSGKGFSVAFYNPEKDNDLLIKYNVLQFSKTVKGFTIFRKDFMAVFIDESISCEEKLYVLLHETGHIILGHIEKKNIQDERFMEMEADAFAYKALEVAQAHKVIKTAVQISAPLVVTALGCACLAMKRKD